MYSFQTAMPRRPRTHLTRPTWLPLVMLAIAFALGGCQSTRVSSSLLPEYGGNSDEAHMNFWHNLAEKRLTSNDEAFHALLLFAQGEDHARTYNGRVMDMKAAGYLPADFDGTELQPVTRGTVAYALVNILDIEGGVTMRLFGPSQRYATRELRYRGLLPESSQNQTFSGGEFVGVIGRAEDFQRSQQSKRAAAPAASRPTAG